MKKILFICLALILNGCIAPYGYGHGYGGNSYYQQPYYNNYSHGHGGYGGYRGDYGGYRGSYGGYRGGHHH